MIKKEYLFNTTFQTQSELFHEATNYLMEKGYVTSEFEQALKEREAHFPTGLPTQPPVAIPHTDGTFVKKDTILCIVNQNKLTFNEMGGDEEDVVFPKVFFLLVLGEGETHLQQLQNLIGKIQGGELVEKALACQTITEFESVIQTYL